MCFFFLAPYCLRCPKVPVFLLVTRSSVRPTPQFGSLRRMVRILTSNSPPNAPARPRSERIRKKDKKQKSPVRKHLLPELSSIVVKQTVESLQQQLESLQRESQKQNTAAIRLVSEFDLASRKALVSKFDQTMAKVLELDARNYKTQQRLQQHCRFLEHQVGRLQDKIEALERKTDSIPMPLEPDTEDEAEVEAVVEGDLGVCRCCAHERFASHSPTFPTCPD